MTSKERASKLEKLEAQKWVLAQAMDDAEGVTASMFAMMALNDNAMQIYYEEMRLAGKSKAQAKKELFKILESSGFKYAAEVRAIA